MRFENLPINWQLVQLHEICELIMGQSPPSSTYNYNGKGLPFFQGKTDFGVIHPTKRVWCNSPKKIVNQNDILLSVRAPVGPTNIALEKSCIGRGLCGIKYKIGKNSKFIFYFFRSIENELAQLGTGSTFQAISKSQISNLQISLPPLNEQHRIVAKLEELFTRLDVSVAELKKAKAQIKRYRQSVLKSAFEGKLKNEFIKEEVVYDREYVKLKDVSEITSSKRIFRHEYVASGVPFYRTKEIKELSEGKTLSVDLFISGERYDEIKSRFQVPKKGDVLLSAVGTIGISYVIKNDNPFYFKDGNIMWFRNLNGIVSSYLSFGLTNFIRNKKGAKISGSAYNALTIETMKDFDFPLPSFEEQKQIVSEIERHFSVADAIEKIINQSLKQAERLRQSILKDAFSGKLVPQDPNDEPAEKLLERIKAEREKTNTSLTRRNLTNDNKKKFKKQ